MGRRLVPRTISGLGKNRFKAYGLGRRCKRGHMAERYSGGGCVACSQERNVSRAFEEKQARAKRTPKQIDKAKAERAKVKEREKQAERLAVHAQWKAERAARMAEHKRRVALGKLSKEALELLG